MKRMLLAAGIAASIALGACSTAQQASASADLTKLQAIVENGCMVVQPTLTAVAALDPTIAAAATANGVFCVTAGAITVTSAQSLLTTGIPAIEKAIAESTVVPADQKPIIMAAIGVFELTVQNALTVFGQSAVSTAPAAAPAAASAAAASQ